MHERYTQGLALSSGQEPPSRRVLNGRGLGLRSGCRLRGIQTRTDDLFELEHPGTNRVRETASNLLAGGGKLVEGGEGVPNHGLEVERTGRLIQGPERFCTVGIELEELVGVRLREVRR